MRPGQAAPVFADCLMSKAIHPSALKGSNWVIFPVKGFNEAGAGCPGIRIGVIKRNSKLHAALPASMRPGQAAPVFPRDAGSLTMKAIGFNEAGAGCPGIHRYLYLFELSG